MIVKNEAARIERCLVSVKPHIACWSITDTGSSDDTCARIRDLLGDLPGYLSHITFENFSQARNDALRAAQQSGFEFDYLLLVDADMELVAPDGFGELEAPGYRMLQKSGELAYWNTRLVRRDNPCRYKGVTHEYLETDLPIENLAGPYFIDHADGANRPGKFDRDIALLEQALSRDPEDARSVFYLAQSYKDRGDSAKAAELYERRAEMGGFDEEVFYSWLAASRCPEVVRMKSATDLALKAFEMRPSRAEPLADLARHYRELGMNETAQMFARRGMEIPPSEDMLFVETGAQEECRNTFAICAFYAKNAETKALGAQICDQLALDRNVSPQTRDTARHNLFWYAKSAVELMPSFAAEQIDFEAPDGYRAMNPSICRHGTRVVMVVRCVNYWIDESGRYIMPEGETAIRTRNFVCDPRSDHAVEIVDLGAPLYDQVLGFEDIRIVPADDGNLFGVATIRQDNAEGYAEQARITIAPDGVSCAWAVMRPEGPRLHEKNWMPVVGGGDRAFIYRCDPTRIVDWTGSTVSEREPEIAADSFSGGSQAIPFDDGWLALIHEAIASPIDGKRCYQHRFVWFSAGLQLKNASRRFYFQSNNQIEFAAGLCWHPDERRLLISYGIKDCEAWLASVDADEVRVLLGLPHQAVWLRDLVEDVMSKPSPRLARFDDDAWVKGQTNRALQERVAIDRARNMLAQFDLPRHPDHPKSWDSYIALWHAFATTHSSGVVLDAGGTRESVFLRGLVRLGFRRLININLDEQTPQTEGHVSYSRGDITATGLPDGTFHFIACLSVLEHGVDWKKFLAETARILVSGGYLFVSVDYWEAPIDTGDRTAFDAPVKIFAPEEIYDFIGYANRLGLDVIGDVDLRCRDRVVNWIGLDFTFLNLLFRKE